MSSVAQPKLTRRAFLQGLAGGAVGAVAASGFAEQQAYSLRVERRELRLPGWTAHGFRVAVLADVHVNFPLAVERARRALHLALRHDPDLVVMVGDFVNSGSPSALRNIGAAFEDVRSAHCPCLAVLGNHDYWTPDPHAVVEAVAGTGLVLLRNEAYEMDGVTVVGIDDALAGRAQPEFVSQISHSRSLLALLHEPDSVDIMPVQVQLQISGHSHGGQFCLPFGVPVHLPKGARAYSAGFYPRAKVPLYVTRGVGTTGLDFRCFCPPEVSLLALRGA